MQIESIIKPDLAAQYRQQGFWLDKTLGQHFDAIVKKYSHKKAIIYKDQEITYSQLEEQVNRTAAGLIEAGLQKGDILS